MSAIVALLLLISAPQHPDLMLTKFISAAKAQTSYTRSYDSSYRKLDYPGGDVPLTTGVCSDVIVRAFRSVGVDLQKEIHEDMLRSFGSYPHQRNWLSKPDSNIDHRRVPNLMTYFARQGKQLPISHTAADYEAGDVVAWDLGRGQLHIGIVSDETNWWGRRKIVHNIGSGTKTEDVIFDWKIIGHYRWFGGPPQSSN